MAEVIYTVRRGKVAGTVKLAVIDIEAEPAEVTASVVMTADEADNVGVEMRKLVREMRGLTPPGRKAKTAPATAELPEAAPAPDAKKP